MNTFIAAHLTVIVQALYAIGSTGGVVAGFLMGRAYEREHQKNEALRKDLVYARRRS